MNLERLKKDLVRREGMVLRTYHCPSGYLTVGVGFNLDAHRPPEHIAARLRATGTITIDDAYELLDISVTATILSCKEMFSDFDSYSDARQEAIADLVFNMGAGGFKKFKKTIAAIKKQDWNTAADELVDSQWYVQVGRRGEEIVGLVRNG